MSKLLSVVVIASFCLGWTPKAGAGVVIDWYANAQRCVFGGPTPAGPAPANRPGPPGLLDLALVFAAVHDAVQAIEGRYEPYRYSNPDMRDVGAPEAAAAAAAYGVLAGLYGADDPCLVGITDPATTYAGDAAVLAGEEAAAALLPLHRPTFTTPLDPFIGSTEPGQWRPTGSGNGANAFMAYTDPFALKRPSQFRPRRQPPMTSTQYSREWEEVRNYGAATGSMRTPEQTDLALAWGNPLAVMTNALRTIVADNIPDTGDQARVLALASCVAADGQIPIDETKYHFNFWRPITALREIPAPRARTPLIASQEPQARDATGLGTVAPRSHQSAWKTPGWSRRRKVCAPK